MYRKIRVDNSIIIVITIITMLPTQYTCHKQFDEMKNRTNIIDRRRSVSGPTYNTDQFIDDITSTSSGSGGCGSCQMRQDIRNRSLESIKSQILMILGMQQPLNTTGRKLPPVSEDMIAQISEKHVPGMLGDQPFKTGPVVTEEEDTLHVKTEKVITFAKPLPRLRHSWKGHGILYFQFSDRITRHRVKQATMYLWVRGSGDRRPSSQDIVIEVFKVVRDPGHPDTPVTLKKARKTVQQTMGEGQWVKLDTTIMVSEWFKSNKDNWGFIVNATLGGQKIVVTDTTEGGSKIPFVEIFTTDSRKKRTKRTVVLNCNEETAQTLCCRYPLTVDFEEFGWDFIIAPKRYEANYCAGDCPYLTLQKYTHTHLAQLANPTNPSTTPCCAAKKMSSISMLYFDQELNVILGSLPGMVVDRCGCS